MQEKCGDTYDRGRRGGGGSGEKVGCFAKTKAIWCQGRGWVEEGESQERTQPMGEKQQNRRRLQVRLRNCSKTARCDLIRTSFLEELPAMDSQTWCKWSNTIKHTLSTLSTQREQGHFFIFYSWKPDRLCRQGKPNKCRRIPATSNPATTSESQEKKWNTKNTESWLNITKQFCEGKYDHKY